jgi:serine/threonine-protein kinase
MPETRPADDLEATRFGQDETRLGDEKVGDGSTEETALGDEPASTILDPYATAMPTTGDPSGLEATVEDPYATRQDPSSRSAGFGGSEGSIPWNGSGAPASAGYGSRISPSRFHPLRLHARGGLGEVYVAVDGELNREVALKEIQERHGSHADSQLRFVFEAEITGGLEHPGIVPVYGLGRYADGRPYYAMRFIRGDSLKAAIEKFHKSDEVKTATSLRYSLVLHQLLARFVSVCHAIDYAHSRGVLHRDMKPDNVMLGGHGETLVVDWGLAKALNRPDPIDESQPKPLRPLSGNDTLATMVGSVMGTPSFMSPEQAAGEVENLGPASDIFSLGSTLYALLTGKAPFRDMPILELLEKVKKADFPAPRTCNRAIPPALEAICLKAMALQPTDRYATAGALAADIERWIADEPVEAFPEPWTIRLGRWARRHRTAVAASFVLLLTASTALGISTFLIGKEKARTEHNYQIARQAVEQMLTRVGEVDLADVPQLESVRRDLLDRALTFYRDFLIERGRDASARVETGRAFGRLGDIYELLGKYVQAEASYREALKILDEPSTDLAARRALARARVNLGILLKKSNRFAESEMILRQGLKDRQAILAEHPDDPDDAQSVAQARYQLGTLLAKLKDRSKEDEALYLEAIAEQKAITEKPTATIEDRRELARYLNNLGILQSASRRDDAAQTFFKAQQIQDEIEARSAGSAAFRWQRARTWNNLAVLFFTNRKIDEAEGYFAKARGAFEALEADFPKIPDYRRERAITLNNLAQLLEVRPSATAKPLDLLGLALEDQRQLVADFPEVPDHKIKLALTLLHLGEFLRNTDPAQAEAPFVEAIAILEKLASDFPQVPEYQAALGRTLTQRALHLIEQDKPDDALKLLDPAIPVLEKARSGNPRDVSYVRFLFDAHTDRATALAKLGRHAELAVEADVLAKVAPQYPDSHLTAAAFLAQCFNMAGSDTALKETYANATLKALQEAIDRKANDPAILDQPVFKSLKARPDFQKLRDDWLARGRKATV